MYKKLLVPLDGSQLAEDTVFPYTESIAGAFGSEVIITNVTRPGDTDMNHLYNSYLDGVARRLEAELAPLSEEAKVGWEILSGSPAEEIIDAAERNKADLIILSSAGRSGLGRWDLGTVAIKLLRASTAPILLIKAREKAEAARPFHRILVPLDGSPEAEVVLPHVSSLATRVKSKVITYRAIDIATFVPADFATLDQTIIRELEATAVQYVCSIRDRLKEQGVSDDCVIDTSVGPTASEIVDYAARHDIDLIAMATHGRSGVSRWVFGSVTEKVLQAAQCPILLVRVPK